MANKDTTITFFADSSIQKQVFASIATECQSRGYNIRYSNNYSEKVPIGFYNEHTHHISSINAETSFVTYHSIDDIYKKPWHWATESWSDYDIGLLPGQFAAEKWRAQSHNPLTRPSQGVFTVGWPKADHVFTENYRSKIEAERKKYADPNESILLYAPSGMSVLPKQFEEFLDKTKNIFDARLVKHRPEVQNQVPDDLVKKFECQGDVHLIDTERNILECLALSDVLITEETSILLEAILTNTIPISVKDWPQSDSWDGAYPKVDRFPESVMVTTRDQLQTKLTKIKSEIEMHKKNIRGMKDYYFAYPGQSSTVIVDIVESVINDTEFPITPTQPNRSRVFEIYWLPQQMILNSFDNKKRRLAIRKIHLNKNLRMMEKFIKDLW